jgi:hypothetical protein
MRSIDSPCKKICLLHPQLQLCTGCGRTLDEIEQWLTLSPEQRIGLIEVARRRLDALREKDIQAPIPAVGNS